MRGTDEAIHKIKRVAPTSSLRGGLSEAKTTKQSTNANRESRANRLLLANLNANNLLIYL
ncbi:hypothetical protein ACWIUD_00035 [Helicobacter sp. 23-1044]